MCGKRSAAHARARSLLALDAKKINQKAAPPALQRQRRPPAPL